MRVVILAGGAGTRLREETETKPKPMVAIGGKPIIWHIMKIYSYYGFNDFVVCLGYKGDVIKEFFYHYGLHSSDVTIDMRQGISTIHRNEAEPWRVTLVETGERTMTGGRLKQVRQYVKDDETFCATYGDGVADVNVKELVAYHQSHGKLATVTAVRPPARFGAMTIDNGMVTSFQEKPQSEGNPINGGFFVLSPKVLDYIDDDMTIWETIPMSRLVADRQLAAYPHHGFWHPMDTVRDLAILEGHWSSERAPWKLWK